MTTPFNPITALDDRESVLVSTYREAGCEPPHRVLPAKWDKLDESAKSMCLWYARNTMSYMDKAAFARHIVGCEILANEAAGVKPVMTKPRVNAVWAMVFPKF
jgi:hypothetical protein